jgi:hypothetical protein
MPHCGRSQIHNNEGRIKYYNGLRSSKMAYACLEGIYGCCARYFEGGLKDIPFYSLI